MVDKNSKENSIQNRIYHYLNDKINNFDLKKKLFYLNNHMNIFLFIIRNTKFHISFLLIFTK